MQFGEKRGSSKHKRNIVPKGKENMTEYNVHRIRFVEFQPQPVNCLAFEDCSSPRLAVSRQDGNLEIWSTWPSQRWTIDFVLPSRDGRSIDSLTWCESRLFSAGLEGEIVEWDLVNLVEKNTVDSNGGPVWSITANHIGTHIAAGCEDGSVRLFDIQNNDLSFSQTLSKQEFRVLTLSWSHCDNMIVTGSTDSTIRVYDVKSRRIISRISTDKLQERSTLTWSIYLTKDMTIITGNSLGQTQFWDANHGTLLQSFKSHEADVLTICVNKAEDKVYSSGIDSRIAEFSFLNDEEDGGAWRLSKKLKSVNHDIRAIAISVSDKPFLVAGGIDPRLTKFKVGVRDWSKTFLPTLPESSPCSVAKSGNNLLFHENDKVHVWKLPSLANSSETSELPQKLIDIKSSREGHITCSDISDDGSVLAFADMQGISAFKLNLTASETGQQNVQVSKLRMQQRGLQGIQKLKVNADGSRIILLSNKGIGAIEFRDERASLHMFTDAPAERKGPWRLLCLHDEKHIFGTVDSKNEIDVFNMKECNHVLRLPKPTCKPMALGFQPGTAKLVYVCAEKDLHIFDYEKEKIDPWCTQLNGTKMLRNLPTKGSNFVKIMFDQKDSDIMFLQFQHGFVKVRLGAAISKGKKNVGKKRKLSNEEGESRDLGATEDVVTPSSLYSSILYMDVNAENSLVVVERPIDDVINALPPALKIKKFGT